MIWCAVANDFVREGRRQMALFVVISASTYLRPGQLLALAPERVVEPRHGASQYWSLLINPEEMGKPSKTGDYDLSLMVDSTAASSEIGSARPCWS